MKKCFFVLCILCALVYWLRRTDERVVTARVDMDNGERYTTEELFKELGIDE